MIGALAILLGGVAACLACGTVLAARRRQRPTGSAPQGGIGDALVVRLGPVGACGVTAFFFLAALFVLLMPIGHLATLATPWDEAVFTWVTAHAPADLEPVVRFVGRMGDKWPTWIAAMTGGVVFALVWRRHRWLPPALMAGTVVAEQRIQVWLIDLIGRVPPPSGEGGPYPSGGCARTVAIYGLIVFFVLAARGTRFPTARGLIIVGTVAGTLGFIEGYTRIFLGKHWLSDAVGGWIFGIGLLAAAIAGAGVAMRGARGASPDAPARSMAMPTSATAVRK